MRIMGAAQTVFSAEDIHFLEKHSIMDRAQVEVGRGCGRCIDLEQTGLPLGLKDEK